MSSCSMARALFQGMLLASGDPLGIEYAVVGGLSIAS